MSEKKVYVIDKEKCISCAQCEAVCPTGAPYAADEGYQIDPEKCEGCGVCAEQCPVEAISVKVQGAEENNED